MYTNHKFSKADHCQRYSYYMREYFDSPGAREYQFLYVFAAKMWLKEVCVDRVLTAVLTVC